ncbi:uncharacterized protein EV422DRAFT_503082 [Fimicolochytrium jonesii]|uniref:uncharacterized protein n=1 Tax=Fimicolochytrium jonesii TaxID=1396493 RepID=UPI0022FE9969|nr:uncharacterized protein EV422DRAFT_503082 [Fimicolochytrium jonesii]KAI8825701.1 hypothetical protein EV422DRAFT_503082 [Fimicolochytrium jonesii]
MGDAKMKCAAKTKSLELGRRLLVLLGVLGKKVQGWGSHKRAFIWTFKENANENDAFEVRLVRLDWNLAPQRVGYTRFPFFVNSGWSMGCHVPDSSEVGSITLSNLAIHPPAIHHGVLSDDDLRWVEGPTEQDHGKWKQ